MAKNWAIIIGINQYRFMQPLKYAKNDAEAVQSFLYKEAKFDRIFLFTDDSPTIGEKPTEPFRTNLLRVLRQIFKTPFMENGDNFWFFFSGHGISHRGQDYLMPQDGDPEDIENSGIPTNIISNYLRGCGADNTVMILDACRNSGQKSGEGVGRQTGDRARQTGIISLFSCSPTQHSYELKALEQGAFTKALIEGLGIKGRCATVKELNQYLEVRVPELITQHLGGVQQNPYVIAEPLNRTHLILMPQNVKSSDVQTLKNDAYSAQGVQNWNLAEQLWIRINLLASGEDEEAIVALQNIALKKVDKSISMLGIDSHNAKSSNEDVLSSERFGRNYYANLRDYLKAGEWKKADQETASRICEVMNRQKEGKLLGKDDLYKFPCTDLRSIDFLWVKYSNGKFGFSVQTKIWQRCGCPQKGGSNWRWLGANLGWRNTKSWFGWFSWYSYSELTFSL